ncbi:MAG: 2,3-bisphosphoglycerate-independent phosphoglycerate mutase [Candidatus Nanohaloarchaea archaeon]
MRPVLLVVMDGVGLKDGENRNAFFRAETPNIDSLMDSGFVQLEASGEAVGLPEGYQGNSEVGHLHLGAGRRVPQRLTRINNAIENGKLAEKEALKSALERAERKDSAIHLAGIVSDGGIHGHIDHLEALMDIASDYDADVFIHCFTDGRDVPPKSAGKYLEQVESWCETYDAEIATVMGRYYSMDRDRNWERTFKAYRAMALGEGFQFESISEPLEATYEGGDYDYFVRPSSRKSYSGMEDDDEVIFYNYRADRERQIEEELVADVDPDDFEEPVHPNFTSMFRYEEDIETPAIFEKKIVEDTLGEKVEDNGYSQLRVAESQKIPHVTYFFNGQRELEFEHEDREFVESDKIKAYDQAPEMHADEIAGKVVDAVEEGSHDFILLNFANGDLVGHTGEMDAAVTAMETVDRNVGRLVDAVDGTDYAMLVTSDHGNCEDMGPEDDPNTSHTTNPVPLTYFNADVDAEDGELWEVANLVERIMDL